MEENDHIFRNYLKSIYPQKILEKILKEDTLEFVAEHYIKMQLEKDYGFQDTVSLRENILKYGKPCKICDNAGFTMTHQEFPGWTGQLKDKKLIIIGGEISPKHSNGFHIAYDLYPKDSSELSLKEDSTPNQVSHLDNLMQSRFGKIISNFEKCAYITDLAKCYCENQPKCSECRKNCKMNLLTEIKILFQYHHEWLIIFQGIDVFSYFKEFQTDLQTKISVSDDQYKNNYYLLIKGILKINELTIPYLVFPHVSPQNDSQWKLILKYWNQLYEFAKNDIVTFLPNLAS